MVLGGIVERAPELVDCRVEALVEVHMDIGARESLPHLFPSDELARLSQQQREDLERSLLEFDPSSSLP